ncbi:hypothetical protein [Streptomyces triticisoli]|uniref:hypothetical protein n=1 Tax=Streptomyces triticisoli TaxID=2182797 RepID=UPI000DDBA154|nr:hypothetical protein [Streptomyces triticisoli]
MAEQKSSSALAAPLHGAAAVLRRVPGAGVVSRAAQETLDKVGTVSPRGRRIAVYTGAGVLGVAGVVEWPVALTGAAVAWLTQPRPEHPADDGRKTLEQTPGTGTTPEDTAPGTGIGARDAAPDTAAAANAAPEGGTTARSAAVDTAPTAQDAAAPRQPARERAAAAREPAEDIGTAALRSEGGAGSGGRAAPPDTGSRGKTPRGHASTGPLGPTARPDRTTR